MRALLMILMTLAVNMVSVRMVRRMMLLALLVLVLVLMLADWRFKHAQHQILVRWHDRRELSALPVYVLLLRAVHPASKSSTLQIKSRIPFVSPSTRTAT